MYRNNDFYEFFLSKTRQLTEDWYKHLNKGDKEGVYASEDPKVIFTVKEQNYQFHVHFCEVFHKEKAQFLAEFEKWIVLVSQDEQHTNTPLQHIIREFHRTQSQYFQLITSFIETKKEDISIQEVESLYQAVVNTMAYVIEWYTEEHNNYAQRRLTAQQALILELSTPVIALSKDVALLPLVGDIDTARAKILLEKTLDECAKLGVSHLLLDLSGVVVIDTAVAHQLFQLIEALSLIGVQTSLSGIRPEIAQTTVHLGLSFDNIPIYPSLAQSINLVKL